MLAGVEAAGTNARQYEVRAVQRLFQIALASERQVDAVVASTRVTPVAHELRAFRVDIIQDDLAAGQITNARELAEACEHGRHLRRTAAYDAQAYPGHAFLQ